MNTQILRHYADLESYMWDGKVTIIYGPRRVGKTTLVTNFLNNIEKTQPKARIYRTTGEEAFTAEALSSRSIETLRDFAGNYDYIFIDEAQAIPGVGLGLKLLIDTFPDRKIIVTGSSSLDLSRHVGEPLTGRQRQLVLYPVSYGELAETFGINIVKNDLADYLTFGMYPEIRTTDGRDDKIEKLRLLTESYLLKDILQFADIQNPLAVRRLLTALAYQVGNLVSLNELATQVQISVKTVQKYLDLLEQCFVLYPLSGYSRNLRSEMVQKRKYYFYDVGIRNSLIGDFNNPSVRGDIGGLFENFVVMERVKYQAYSGGHANNYFWRTDSGAEIDYVEDYDGTLHAFEIKWNPKTKVRPPRQFAENYPEHAFDVVNRDNLVKYVVG